jgi:hypothetical protein
LNSFDLSHTPEPLLEFAANGRHIDVRFGLMDYGPVDFSTERTKEIRLGVVGSSQTVGRLGDWLGRCEGASPRRTAANQTSSPAFPAAPFSVRFGAASRSAPATCER